MYVICILNYKIFNVDSNLCPQSTEYLFICIERSICESDFNIILKVVYLYLN